MNSQESECSYVNEWISREKNLTSSLNVLCSVIPTPWLRCKQIFYPIFLYFPVSIVSIYSFIVYHEDPFAHTRLRKIIYQHSLYVIAARN